MNKMSMAFVLMLALFVSITAVPTVMAAHVPASPPGCDADNSVVNLARSSSSAEVGETITWTVSAGNPDSVDGCDVVNRTLIVTLPDGSQTDIGTYDYPNPTPTQIVGSVNYVASIDDLNGNDVWTATVSWNGTLLDGVDSSSTGSKELSSTYVPTELNISKTADPQIDTELRWTIEKSVEPDSWVFFDGENGTSTYTINVTKDTEAPVYSVSGTITIVNPSGFVDANITSVDDTITGVGSVAVDCGVTFPYLLAPEDDLVCTYNTTLPDNQTRTNTVNVTTTGEVLGGGAQALINFTGVSESFSGDLAVNVSDSLYGDFGPFTETSGFTYDETFDCDAAHYTNGVADMIVIENTATIVQNDESDSANVTVQCYQLLVEKTAQRDHNISYEWTIDKTGNVTELILEPGEAYPVNYTVELEADEIVSDYVVSGTITISNPYTEDIVLSSVSDDLGDVDCPSLTVPAGGNLVCTYSGVLEDPQTENNTASVMFGDREYNATTAIEHNPAGIEDECVLVDDDQYGELGEVCVGDEDMSFSYLLDVSYEVCLEEGEDFYEFVNIASFATVDTQTTGNSSWMVLVDVPCEELLCTYTRGYWQTHSIHGPAPYDDTWAVLWDENVGDYEEFFLSGQTWLEVMWTPPAGGNSYYQLAPQYVAAWLNIESGASAPQEVADAMDRAEELFLEYEPSDVVSVQERINPRGRPIGSRTVVNRELADEMTYLAGILDDYNNGLIGPGHCDE